MGGIGPIFGPAHPDVSLDTFTGATGGQVPAWDAVAAKLVPRDLGFLNAKLPPFNAKGDAVQLTDAAVATGTNVLTSASATFTAADVGKQVRVIQQGFTITGTMAAGTSLVTSVSGWPAGLSYENGMTITGGGLGAGSAVQSGIGTATLGVSPFIASAASGATLTVSGYVAINGTITGFTDAHTVTVSAAWAGTTSLAGCTAVYGTDDTAALNSLLAVATDATRMVPKGNYLHTGVDVTAGFSDLSVMGSGASWLWLAPGSNKQAVRFNELGNDNSATIRGTRLTVRDLKINMFGATQRSATPASGGTLTPTHAGTKGGCIAIGVDRVNLVNVDVVNSRDTGFDLRGCNHVYVSGCRHDTAYFTFGGNGYNLGGNVNYTGSDIIVTGNEAINVCDVAFSADIAQSKRNVFTGNISVGGRAGVLAESGGTNDTSVQLVIANNIVKDARNIGVGAAETAVPDGLRRHFDTTIAGNQLVNCATAITHSGSNATITANIVDGYTVTGINLGGGSAPDQYNIAIGSNAITAGPTATGDGILVNGYGLNSGSIVRSVAITGNTVEGAAAGNYGIRLVGWMKSIGIVANTVSGFKKSGIFLGTASSASPFGVRICDNDVRNNNRAVNAAGTNSAGISVNNASDRVLVEGNRCTDDQAVLVTTTNTSTSVTVTQILGSGDYPANGTSVSGVGIPASTTVSSGGGSANLVLSNAATADGTGVTLNTKTQTHGLFWNTATNGTIVDNDFTSNLTSGLNATFDQGTVAAHNQGWTTISVASSGTITLPPGEMVRVNGTTTITTINPPPADVRQTLRFSGALTLTNSSTLKLAGAANFVTTADDTITLASDGTTMWEVCRSVN